MVLGNTIPKQYKMQRSRGWCWTLNNYSEEEYINMKEGLHTTQLDKWIIGKEVGSQGTSHLQGYFYFNNGKSFSAVCRINSKAHWEKAKGTPEHNYNYCSKEGDFECYGWNMNRIHVKHGGYASIEEQVESEALIAEERDYIEDTVRDRLNELQYIDELYDEIRELEILRMID